MQIVEMKNVAFGIKRRRDLALTAEYGAGALAFEKARAQLSLKEDFVFASDLGNRGVKISSNLLRSFLATLSQMRLYL